MTPTQAFVKWDAAVAEVMSRSGLNRSRAADALLATESGRKIFEAAKGAKGVPGSETSTETFLQKELGADELARLRAEHSKRAATRFRNGVNALVATGMSRSQASDKAAQDMGDSWRDVKDARGTL